MRDGNLPFTLLTQPLGSLDLLLRPNVLINIVLSCNALPVFSNLRALSEFLRPLRIGRKARLVGMRGYITSHARVSIFKPCTSLETKL